MTTTKNSAAMVRPRIYLGNGSSIGPGKINLLKMIAQTHSISGAARALKIPYKRAWHLIDSLNQSFESPIVETMTGGKRGGGSTLTELGELIIKHYDDIEQKINATVQEEIADLARYTKALGIDSLDDEE